jgi:hypothetical protein
MTRVDADIALCRDWAIRYHSLGFCPIPSRSDAKRPAVYYRELRDEGIGVSLLRDWRWQNCQLACGARWGLVVLDLDGPEALEAWREWTRFRHLPPTWTVRTGGEPPGLHLWWGVVRGTTGTSVSKLALWRGLHGHSAVELLCDRSLVVAPPSLHAATGRRYEFLPGLSPDDLPRPAPMPAWLAGLLPVGPRQSVPRRPTLSPAVSPLVNFSPTPLVDFSPTPESSSLPPGGLLHRPRSRGPSHDWRAVWAVVRPHALDLARSWGLETTGPPSTRDQVPVREDLHPSCEFNLRTGATFDHATGEVLSFWDLPVARGLYPDFPTVVNDLGSRYLSRRPARAS